jgi:hypothetical protein
MDVLGKPQPYTGTIMAIDPSGTGADETSYAVVKMLNGQLFVPSGGVGGLQGGYSPAVLQELVLIAKRNKVNKVIIESNFGDSMFTALIRPYFTKLHPCELVDVRQHKQKELRIIDTLEPVMNQHKLIFDRNCITQDTNVHSSVSEDSRLQYQLFYQMTRITKDKGALRHDDRIDALATAVQYWLETMSQDADDSIKERERRDSDVLLRSFELNRASVIDALMGATTAQMEQLQNASRSGGGGLLRH